MRLEESKNGDKFSANGCNLYPKLKQKKRKRLKLCRRPTLQFPLAQCRAQRTPATQPFFRRPHSKAVCFAPFPLIRCVAPRIKQNKKTRGTDRMFDPPHVSPHVFHPMHCYSTPRRPHYDMWSSMLRVLLGHSQRLTCKGNF